MTGARAVAISPDGNHAYIGGSSSLAAYDLSTIAGLTARGLPTMTGAIGGLAFAADQAPQAKFNPVPAPAGSASTFEGGPSLDGDGSVTSWSWDFGDGTTSTGPQTAHVYATPGTYTARLTVTDDEGCSTTSKYTGQQLSCSGSPYATAMAVMTFPWRRSCTHLRPGVRARRQRRVLRDARPEGSRGQRAGHQQRLEHHGA